MRTRTRIHPYVVPEIAHRLAAYCGAKGLTESAAVEAAIGQYLDAGEKDNALILRRLDRLGRASAQHQRDLEVLSEAFAVFVYRWVGSLPELAPAERDLVNRLSEKKWADDESRPREREAQSARALPPRRKFRASLRFGR